MKNLFYRFSSTRSLAKLFLILAFVALGSLFTQQALAQCDPNTDPTCPPPWDFGSADSSAFGSFASTISCTKNGKASNLIDDTSVTQTEPVKCTLSTFPNAPAACLLTISYSGLVPQCRDNGNGTSTLTDVAFCGNGNPGLIVAGTLNCNPQNLNPLPVICGGNNPCIAQLDGITGVPPGQCAGVFPAATNLAAGQVLSAKVTSKGSICTGEVVDASQISNRFCSSGSFNQAISSRCGNQNNPFVITGTTTLFLPVAIAVSPQTINVKCSPKKDNGSVTFTIFGSDSVDVTLINESSLALEGVPVLASGGNCSETDSNHDGFLDLSCSVPSCPDLGPALKKNENPDTTVDVVVTGSLNLGTKIQGDVLVGTSGN